MILKPCPVLSVVVALALSAPARASGPDPEVCDGIDNDGNGLVDDGVVATVDGQNADSVEEAIDRTVDGSIVRICPGSYAVQELVIERSIQVIGQGGSEQVLLRSPGGPDVGELLRVSGTATVHLEGLTLIEQDADLGWYIEDGLVIETGTSVTGVDLWIEGLRNGVDVGPGASVTLVDSVVRKNVVGIAAGPGAYAGLLGTLVGDSLEVGIALLDATLWGGLVTLNPIGVAAGGKSVVIGADISLNTGGQDDDGEPINGGGVTAGDGVTLLSCYIHDNNTEAAGGGVYAIGAIQIDDTRIERNVAGNGGGGVYAGGPLTIDDSLIVGNSADVGGGIYASSSVWAERTVVEANEASMGGGLALSEWEIGVISGLEIRGNHAERGGAIGMDNDWEVSDAIAADWILQDLKISANTASDGGGIWAEGQAKGEPWRLTLVGVDLTDNDAQAGGGLWIGDGTEVSVQSSSVLRNTAKVGGAAAVVAPSVVAIGSSCSDWGVSGSVDDNNTPDVDLNGAVWAFSTTDFTCDPGTCWTSAPLCDDLPPLDELK